MILPIESELALREKLSNQEILKQLGLSREVLGVFEDPPIRDPETLGASLQITDKPIVVWTSQETAEAGQAYMDMLGFPSHRHHIVIDNDPVASAQLNQEKGVLSLVITSSIDPTLKDKMFENPDFGQLFADGIYLARVEFESPLLYCVGITTQGLREIESEIQTISDRTSPDNLARERSRVQKDFLKPDQLTSWEFRKLLKSDRVEKVLAHGLGPEGTNISQSLKEYVGQLGIGEKTEITIHPRGVEPLNENGQEGYAEIAAKQIVKRVIPVHMECAVYYKQWRLWEDRGKDETVFADHHYMPLDSMMVAGPADLTELLAKDRIVIATHPSPKSLVDNWLALDHVEWKRASSNSAAAEMVVEGKADLCITTGEGLTAFPGQLQSIHVCGSPMMVFTIGTPLSNQQLAVYL